MQAPPSQALNTGYEMTKMALLTRITNHCGVKWIVFSAGQSLTPARKKNETLQTLFEINSLKAYKKVCEITEAVLRYKSIVLG